MLFLNHFYKKFDKVTLINYALKKSNFGCSIWKHQKELSAVKNGAH